MNLKSVNKIKNQMFSEDDLNDNHSSKISEKSKQFGLSKFSHNNALNVIKTQFFDLQDSIKSGKRTYLKVFDTQRTSYVASEILLINPFYKKQNLFLDGIAIWYQDDEEVGRNNFKFEVKKEWEIVEIVQSWGTQVPGFWKKGECKIEIYLEERLISSKLFYVNDYEEVDFSSNEIDESIEIETKTKPEIEKNDQNPPSPAIKNESLESILTELNSLVGLGNLKNSLSDFISYINFLQERKNQGIESNENLSAHCIFLGNPGTGKTSVARLLGRFFKSIGVLEHGHIIEVDRSSLVGEFIGQTAQKTERVIQQAIGGILFIDEAYSLKRDNDSKDFGQEAIDILLKRMEDLKGKFFVIVAGYPELMHNFLNSNPGLKSRFTHTFDFEDFSSEELTKIFKSFAAKENFNLSKSAEKLLIQKLDLTLENTNESFGNARFIRNLYNETKIHLSKRYQLLPYDERTFTALSTIIHDDILSAFNHNLNNLPSTSYKEDKLEKYINELHDLIGLDDVKNNFIKLLASIKIDRMKKERGISSNSKNLNSIFIAEPGSGTSTVARLLGKIFKELSLLQSGQVVELNFSVFDGLSKIDSYLLLDKLFQDSVGKIILVNDSIQTLQAKKDFSDSLLQYFLKKLYLNNDKVIAILCGNGEELEDLLSSIPVVQNQFPNVFNFGQYSNRQLLEIALKICSKKNYQLDEGAWQRMLELLSGLREDSNSKFYNTRTIKKILDKAISNQEERIISIDNPKDVDLMTLTYEDFIEV